MCRIFGRRRPAGYHALETKEAAACPKQHLLMLKAKEVMRKIIPNCRKPNGVNKMQGYQPLHSGRETWVVTQQKYSF